MNTTASRKHPFAFAGFAALGCTLFISVLGMIIHVMFKTGKEAAVAMAMVIAAMLYALFIRGRLGKRFRLGITGEGFREATILLLPIATGVVLNTYALVSAFFTGTITRSFGEVMYALLVAFLEGLQAGVSEEIIFRVCIFGAIMHIAAGKTWRVPAAVIVSSLAFGLMHMSNVTIGVSLSGALLQSFYTIGMGVLFAAVYARTHNLLALIITHTVLDVIALMSVYLFIPAGQTFEAALGTAISASTSGAAGIISLIITAAEGLIWLGCGIWMLRGSKREEIEARWSAEAVGE